MVQSGKYVYPNNFILMNNTRYASFKVLETCSKVIRLGKWTKVHNHCVISLTPALSALARQGRDRRLGLLNPQRSIGLQPSFVDYSHPYVR